MEHYGQGETGFRNGRAENRSIDTNSASFQFFNSSKVFLTTSTYNLESRHFKEVI